MSRSTADDLSARLAALLRREHAAMADFLVALADFDRQRLWLDLGYPGLFVFLHRELGLSKGAAHFRKVAADLVQRFPEIVEPLRDGRLCITSVVELAKVATRDNLAGVLPRFFHRSRREAREVAVEIRPAAVVPLRDVTTSVPAGPAADAPGAGGAPDQSGPSGRPGVLPVELDAPVRDVTVPSVPDVPAAPAAARRDGAEPLTAELSRLHVTVSRRFLAKLEHARAALSHSHPGAGAEEILEVGLDLLLARHAKRRGLVARPRAAKGAAAADNGAVARPQAGGTARKAAGPANAARTVGPDHIPASVRREVWRRDDGRCQWPVGGRAGGICGSRLRVEYDHVVPRARSGSPTAQNLRLLCHFHNQIAARLAFGDAWMDRFASGVPPPTR